MFHTRKHDSLVGGRRVAIHEYPRRNRPHVEDMGSVTRNWEFDAYLVDENYDFQRDALIAACRADGAGVLVHPYLGAVRVICTKCRVAENSEEGNIARMSLAFVDIGANQQPEVAPNFTALIGNAAGATRSALVASFVSAWRS